MIWMGAANLEPSVGSVANRASRAPRLDTLEARIGPGSRTRVASQSTREIVAQARSGDSDAFEALFRAHGDEVLRVCRRMLGGHDSAVDAQSEVFLKARRALDGYDADRPFRSWLIAIASHHCIDQLRRVTTERRVFVESEAEPGELPGSEPSPLSHLLAQERHQALDAAIEALPVQYRLPLMLRYFSEASYDEIAESLGTSRASVGTLLFRAKRKLRAQLSSRTGASKEATRNLSTEITRTDSERVR